MDKKLIIMAAGASSRMKRSLETSELTPETKKIASSAHKSLIPLGFKQKPLLFHLNYYLNFLLLIESLYY